MGGISLSFRSPGRSAHIEFYNDGHVMLLLCRSEVGAEWLRMVFPPYELIVRQIKRYLAGD
jgi:hypothetical protein